MSILQPFKVLTDNEIVMIHETALRVLAEVGVSLPDPAIVDQLKEAGAWVDKADDHVHISRDMVETALNKAPHQFNLYDRQQRELSLNVGRHFHISGAGNLRVLDYPSGQTRVPTLHDVEMFTRLGDALPLIKGVMPHFLRLDQDLDPDIEELYIYQTVAKNTNKLCLAAPRNAKMCQIWLDLGQILAGEEKLCEHPVINLEISPTAPLSWDTESLQSFILSVCRGVPVVILTGPICGASGPITLAGAAVTRTAEWLFGLTLAQVANPGAPIILGDVGNTILDMRTSDLGAGGPEYAISSVAGAQMAHFYNLPSYSCAPWSDSKSIDAQIGTESLGAWLSAIASGVDITINAGSLNRVTTGSLEQMVIHHEILEWMDRYVAGIAVNEDTLAFDAIKRVGPSGSFLGDRHTRSYLRTGENIYLRVFDRTSISAPSKNILDVAHKKVEETLKNYHPNVSEKLCQEIDAYVKEVEPSLRKS